MRAIEISKPGGPEVLTLCDRPMPEPGPGEVVIKIAYAGVNRPDALQRAGMYDPPKEASDLPGLEASGTIHAVGEGVDRRSVGDEICALLPGGGYAEYAVTPAAHCLRIPDGMALREAACLPETYFTVWTNVFDRGRLRKGETLLVHGGSSGIGTTAIQMAKAFGNRVIVTAGSEDKLAACRDLGADLAINYREDDFVEAVRADGGADVVLDMVGGSYIARNLKCLKTDGRLVQIAFLQGSKAEVDFTMLMVRRLTMTGSTLRPQSIEAKAEIAEALLGHAWPLLDTAEIGPVMDQEFALEEASKAHARMEAGDHIGKIVLKV